jgi:aspartyl-tRNA synthetase
MRFSEAMSRFGVDKPDTRYGIEIQDISKLLSNSTMNIFKNALNTKETIKCINAKKLGGVISSKELEAIQEEAKIAGSKHVSSIFILLTQKGVITIKVQDKEWKSSITKHLTQEERDQIASAMNVENGDLLILAVGPHLDACSVLGRVRIHCAWLSHAKQILNIPTNTFNFMWVVDFPLFSLEPDLCSTHHPFTAPLAEDLPLLDSNNQDDLLSIRGLHYDVVVNGVELGGGSIRIHNSDVQRKVFEKINFKHEGIQQFSHLLEALKYGCPPHGGLALGLDRMIALLVGAPNLREVVAFPKTSTGNELMTGAPSEITPAELEEFGLAYRSQKQ